MKFTVFIPTLNEEIGLKQLLPRIIQQNPHQIIVSDGNSKDCTRQVAASMGAQVYTQKQKGIRHAYIEAWPMITTDLVITLSPDGNCVPEDIPKLITHQANGNWDMVIASRYYQGQKSEDDDLITGFGNWFFTNTVNLLFGGQYTDVMGIYRLYRTGLFQDLGLNQHSAYTVPEAVFHTVIGIEPLLSVRALAYGKRVSEVGSLEPARIGGERKLQIIRWGGAYYLQFWLEFFRKLQRR